MAAELGVEDLSVAFGGISAVNSVTFSIEAGTTTGLIGPNGSGKTTLFNLITGLLHPDAGQIRVEDRSVGGWPPYRIARLGLARTFQLSRLFGQMTVWENMLVAPRDSGRAKAGQDRAAQLLADVNLLGFRDHLAADLSYGQQKLLELVRALMLEPRILLLDEPFAGVNPTMARTILDLLGRLREMGMTILVIDHAMAIIMDFCERLLVMDMGTLIADGQPSAIRNNAQVLEAYFGTTSGRDASTVSGTESVGT